MIQLVWFKSFFAFALRKSFILYNCVDWRSFLSAQQSIAFLIGQESTLTSRYTLYGSTPDIAKFCRNHFKHLDYQISMKYRHHEPMPQRIRAIPGNCWLVQEWNVYLRTRQLMRQKSFLLLHSSTKKLGWSSELLLEGRVLLPQTTSNSVSYFLVGETVSAFSPKFLSICVRYPLL